MTNYKSDNTDNTVITDKSAANYYFGFHFILSGFKYHVLTLKLIIWYWHCTYILKILAC